MPGAVSANDILRPVVGIEQVTNDTRAIQIPAMNVRLRTLRRSKFGSSVANGIPLSNSECRVCLPRTIMRSDSSVNVRAPSNRTSQYVAIGSIIDAMPSFAAAHRQAVSSFPYDISNPYKGQYSDDPSLDCG